MRRLAVFAGLAALATTSHADTVDVNVFDFEFSINAPTEPVIDPVIDVGDTIRWTFLDAFHTVTSVSGIPEVFDSGFVSVPGTTFEHTFTNLGTFYYYCQPHGSDNGDGTASGMVGTVTVVPAPAAGVLLCAGAGFLARRRR